MDRLEQQLPEDSSAILLQDIRASLRRLERRDWWLWWAAVVVMLLLTVAVVSLSIPALLKEQDSFSQFHLQQAVRGLVGLVLLFNTYTIYQQILIKRLRRQLAEQIDAIAHLELRAQEFHNLSLLDPLTGLYNRRFAEQRLSEEVARSRRHGNPLTVLALDLNDFKQINDRYGHPAGDLVLKAFAERLRKVSRGSDLAVRLGGDEFLVLLPECRPDQVRHLLPRLGPLEVDFHGKKIPVTFSAGWAGYQFDERPEQLLERADQALYADKRAAKQGVPPITAAR